MPTPSKGRDAARRLRVTTHEPLSGKRIGLVVWFGSIDRGWTGKHVAPWKWNRTWRITSDGMESGCV